MKRDYPSIDYRKQNTLHNFYAQHFPMNLMHLLATRNNTFHLWQREICPRENVRNYMFQNAQQVMQVIKELKEMSALQFGPIFPTTHRPSHVYPPKLDDYESNLDHAKPRHFERQSFKEEQPLSAPFGEVVIDMDMDSSIHDRSKMCKCGDERKVCDICWRIFMRPALLVLYAILSFMGIKRHFTVFSGRRGFHLWLWDDRCFYWTQEQRAKFIDTIQRPAKGSELYKLCKDILQPLYEENKHLLVIPSGINAADACFVLYPAMDRAVTADATHLHKLPLTLHSETLNLCTVIDAEFVPTRDIVHASNVRRNVMAEHEGKILRVLANAQAFA